MLAGLPSGQKESTLNDLHALLDLAVDTAHRLNLRIHQAEEQLIHRPILARRMGNTSASLLVEVSSASDYARIANFRSRTDAIAALRESRKLVGSVRHAVTLDCALIYPELRKAISNDCEELLALLLAATAEAVRSSTLDSRSIRRV